MTVNPPVVETVMAVRFRELSDFTSARVGQFWERHLYDEFPVSEDHPPYAAPVERFGPGGDTFELQLKLSEVPPPTRAWFIGGNSIVQLQSDWFAFNWRKTDQDPDYIRYGRARERFEQYFSTLDTFVRTELQKALSPIQAEVTYVNQIQLDSAQAAVGPLGDVVRGARPAAGEVLPRPEGAQLAWSYLIPDDGRGLGRLHLSASSVEDRSTQTAAVRLVLTARGRPRDETISGALAFFDLGHESIVRGFKDVTTEPMWKHWGLIRKAHDGGH